MIPFERAVRGRRLLLFVSNWLKSIDLITTALRKEDEQKVLHLRKTIKGVENNEIKLMSFLPIGCWVKRLILPQQGKTTLNATKVSKIEYT